MGRAVDDWSADTILKCRRINRPRTGCTVTLPIETKCLEVEYANMRIRSSIVKVTLAAALVAGSLTAVGTVGNGAAYAAQATAVVEWGVNLRTGPSTSAKVIRMLKKGERISVISQTNKYWLHVRDANGKTGYISSSPKYTSIVSGGSQPAPSKPSASSKSVEAVIAAGMKYLGTPYEYGSSRSNTRTFDCSDFVRQAFLDGVGLKLPADSRSQGKYVKDKGGIKTNWRNLKRGDLMFFMSYRGSKASAYAGVNKSTARITHVGIYLGDGKVLHTYSKESGGVRVDSIVGKHWEYRFLYGGSAL
ncbi:SH3 domain-containing C40 family peptidase [Paenibacillus cisolokensis]|uniref:C40 family peptidase n=1 Tax=Paenibacillus cisolokensis TaxID=1658519 RepID=UPI003D27FAFA